MFPQSIVYIGNVPWDNSYRHVRYYSSTIDQYNDIMSCMQTSYNASTYTYIRENNSVKVLGAVETLRYCNYIMYRNANFPSRWCYAFITECNYINDNTTELVFETDLWQTYCFGVNFVQYVYTERRHVSSDTVGAHLMPEPALDDPVYYYCNQDNSAGQSPRAYLDLLPDAVIVQSTADVSYQDIFGPNTWPQSKVDIQGELSGGVGGSTRNYIFPRTPGAEMGWYRFIWDLNTVGAGDAVTNVFMYPSVLLNESTEVVALNGHGDSTSDQAWSNHRAFGDTTRRSLELKIPRPTEQLNVLRRRTPRHAKMLTYPFTFARLTTPTGNFIDLKFEYWGSDYWKTVIVWAQCQPNASAIALPVSYGGIYYDLSLAVSFPVVQRCSYQYGAYANWSAQHGLMNAVNAAADIAMVGIPIPQVKGGGAVLRALSGGVARIARQKGAQAAARQAVSRSQRMAAPNLVNPFNPTGETASILGMSGLASMAGEYAYNASLPNVSRGTVDGSSIFNGYSYSTRVELRTVQMAPASWAIYENFFDMYGYAVNDYNYVGSMTRSLWTYYKTVNASFRSVITTDVAVQFGVPEEALSLINKMFDNGVTLWNTTTGFGNYDVVNNYIV